MVQNGQGQQRKSGFGQIHRNYASSQQYLLIDIWLFILLIWLCIWLICIYSILVNLYLYYFGNDIFIELNENHFTWFKIYHAKSEFIFIINCRDWSTWLKFNSICPSLTFLCKYTLNNVHFWAQFMETHFLSLFFLKSH